jgi:hypothetical protein
MVGMQDVKYNLFCLKVLGDGLETMLTIVWLTIRIEFYFYGNGAIIWDTKSRFFRYDRPTNPKTHTFRIMYSSQFSQLDSV